MITKSIRLWFGVAKTIPSAQMYIDRFASLQVTLKDQNKKLQQLRNQQRLALEAQQMNIPDHINKLISKLTGSRFEPKAIRNQREELVHYRQYLESLIEQSDKKWQKPRQEIIKLRKQMSEQFLSKFVKLEYNLMKNCTYQTSPELAEGLTLIHRLLINTLQKHGVVFYEPNIGDAFSADLYDTVDKGTVGQKIKQVVSKGWRINQKVIKKPIVKLE